MRNPCPSESPPAASHPHIPRAVTLFTLLQRQGLPRSSNGAAWLGRVRQRCAACDLETCVGSPIPMQASKIHLRLIPSNHYCVVFSVVFLPAAEFVYRSTSLTFQASRRRFCCLPKKTNKQQSPSRLPCSCPSAAPTPHSEETRSFEVDSCDQRGASAIVPASS